MTAKADAHLHIFARGFQGVHGVSPAGDDELLVYERLRIYHGIERALIVGYEGHERYRSNNRDILGLASTRAWMTPLVYLSATHPPSLQSLEAFYAQGAAGYVLYVRNPAEAFSLERWPRAIFSELCAQRPIISINAPPEGIAELRASVEKLGEGCHVLFSHLGLPGRYSSLPTRAEARERLGPLVSLADLPHVGVKVSALYAISEPPHNFPHEVAGPFVFVLLEAFGPSRVMWGSDFPVALDFVSFPQLLEVKALDACTPKEREAVMGGNLLRWLPCGEAES